VLAVWFASSAAGFAYAVRRRRFGGGWAAFGGQAAAATTNAVKEEAKATEAAEQAAGLALEPAIMARCSDNLGLGGSWATRWWR